MYQRDDETQVGWLFQMVEDQSGEAGSYDRDYRGSELRDVGGGPELEWVAVVVEEEGDSFEADRCYAHTAVTSSLLICGLRSDRFACAQAQFSTRGESRPRAKEDLYDCDDDPDSLEPARTTGFANRYAFEAGGVVFTPDPDAAIDVAEEPPYTGAATLETLFDASALSLRGRPRHLEPRVFHPGLRSRASVGPPRPM